MAASASKKNDSKRLAATRATGAAENDRYSTNGETPPDYKRTSRICIKNLPPKVAETDQLKKHLFQSQKSFFAHTSPLTITDCKILPKRRMCFVGFSTVDAAAACVHYLHRSYFLSSRLIVEFAHPPPSKATQQQPGTTAKDDDSKQVNETISDTNELDNKQARKDAKLQKKKDEFLAAMGVSFSNNSKGASRSWANDDGISAMVSQNINQGEHDEDSSVQSNEDEGGVNKAQDESSVAKSKALESAVQSDLDFLRSKTVTVQDFDTVDDGLIDREDDQTKHNLEEKSSEELPTQENEAEDSQVILDEPKVSYSSSRLFVRNIPFTSTEEDLEVHFSSFGAIEECHIPVDDQYRRKGYGFVSFTNPKDAQAAREALDGQDFQGRFIQVLPAHPPPSSTDQAESGLTFKEQREMERQKSSAKNQTGWSASHVRGDAVVDNLATRLGLGKGEVLAVKDGMSGGDAAVRLALGETAIIEENRKYFLEHGIDMEALVSFSTRRSDEEKTQARSATSVLVKNLPYDTSTEELRKMFGSIGSSPVQILLPPSKTVAVIDYGHQNDAKRAFKKLAYRRFKNVPLYLEWAPLAAVKDRKKTVEEATSVVKNEMEVEEVLSEVSTSSIYVKNLNFSTTEEELKSFFEKSVSGVRAVRIPMKTFPTKRSRPGEKNNDGTKVLSLGYGFVEFERQEDVKRAMKELQGATLRGHDLQLQFTNSGGGVRLSKEAKRQQPSKLMVRNVPFQANRKELLQLFGSFGQLRRVRLPKKFDGTHRGFAFVDYVSSNQAAEAMRALSRTHLYGRHLVLEWAEDEEETVEELREKVQHSAQKQNKKIKFS